MRVEVLVNYEIPSLNTSPTLNLVQSYIFSPELVSSLSIMSLFFHEYVSFSVEEKFTDHEYICT